MTRTHEDRVHETYLGLRLAMILLVGLLFASVAFQIVASDPTCLQGSISAYYYTAARPVFVASLCAVGACLVLYRGNTDNENILLDVSGFLAFIVAFVPTTVDTLCEASNVPTAEELSASVNNNVWVLLGLASLALLLGWRQAKIFKTSALDGPARWSLLVSGSALVVGVVFFLLGRDTFETAGHSLAAIALFVGFIAVVVVNAVGFEREKRQVAGVAPLVAARNRYGLVAGAMVVTLVLGGFGWIVRDSFVHWLFFLEAALIFEFGVFWLIQTFELQGKVTRHGPQSRLSTDAPN